MPGRIWASISELSDAGTVVTDRRMGRAGQRRASKSKVLLRYGMLKGSEFYLWTSARDSVCQPRQAVWMQSINARSITLIYLPVHL